MRAAAALVTASILAAPAGARAEPEGATPPEPGAASPADLGEASEALAFGAWLAGHGEGERAVTELLRVEYLGQGTPLAASARLSVARAYHRQRAYLRAAAAYRASLAEPSQAALPEVWIDLAAVQLRLGQVKHARASLGRATALAEPALRASAVRRRAFVLGAIAYIQEGDYLEAAEGLRSAGDLCREPEAQECRAIGRSLALVEEGPPPPRRPWLAAGLSAAVPGLGELYAGHPFDGLFDFGVTGLFGFLALDGYDGGRSLGGQRAAFFASAGLAVAFYVRGIFSARDNAYRWNAVQNLRHRRRFLETAPWPAPPG